MAFLVVYLHERDTTSSMVICRNEAAGRKAFDDAYVEPESDSEVQLWEVPVTDGEFRHNAAKCLASKGGDY